MLVLVPKPNEDAVVVGLANILPPDPKPKLNVFAVPNPPGFAPNRLDCKNDQQKSILDIF